MRRRVLLIAIILILTAFCAVFSACGSKSDKVTATAIEIDASSLSSSLIVGDAFPYDSLSLTCKYSNGSTTVHKVTSDMVSSIDTTTPGKKVASVSFKSFSASFEYQIGGILRYTADGDGYIEGKTTQKVAFGGNASSVQAVSYDGYAFDRWSDGVTTAARTDTEVTVFGTITASFKVQDCTVRMVDSNGNLLDTRTVSYGDELEPYIPDVGYEVVGYYAGGVKLQSLTANGSMDIEVRIRPVQITVSYIGGSEASRIFDYGSALTFPSPIVPTGMQFKHWANAAGEAVSEGYRVVEPLYLTAVFNRGYRKVTLLVGTERIECDMEYGEVFAAPDTVTPPEGYVIVGYTDSEGKRTDAQTVITSACSFTAVLERVTCDVTYDTDGVLNTDGVLWGDCAVPPQAPTKEGFVFTHWSLTNNGEEPYDFGTAVKKPVTLYAVWGVRQCEVHFVYMYNSTVDVVKCDYGSVLALAAPERVEYELVGWYFDRSFTNACSVDYEVKTDLSLFAKWTVKTFAVNVNAKEGGSVELLSASPIVYGSYLSFSAIPNEGYCVSLIKVNGVDYSPVAGINGKVTRTISTITSVQNVEVTFVKKQITVTLSNTEGGTSDKNGSTVLECFSPYTVLFTASVGYKLSYITVNGVKTFVRNSRYTIDSVTADTVIRAVFDKARLTVAVKGTGFTTDLSDNTAEVIYGNGLSFRITAAVNTYIQKITVTPSSGDSYTYPVASNATAVSVNLDSVTSATTLSVTVKGLETTITATATSGGTISPSGTVKAYFGELTTYVFTPSKGHYVRDVVFNGQSQGAAESFDYMPVNVGGDVLTVYFDVTYNNVYVGTTGNGSVDCGGNNSVAYGSDLSIVMTAEPNYHVSHYVMDGVLTYVNRSTYTLTLQNVIKSHSISVVFAVDTHTVTVTSGLGGRVIINGSTSYKEFINTQQSEYSTNYGSAIMIYADDGYHIASVTLNDVSSGVSDSDGLTSYSCGTVGTSLALVVAFAPDEYTVSGTSGSGGRAEVAATARYGDKLTLQFIPDTGYEVDTLTVNNQSVTPTENYAVDFVSGNVTYAVTFKLKSYDVEITVSEGGSVSDYPLSVNYGDSFTVTFTADSHYLISSFASSASFESPVGKSSYVLSVSSVNDKITVSAAFAKETFDVALTVGEGGVLRRDGFSFTGSSSDTLEYGTTATYSIAPSIGYEIASLSVDGVQQPLSSAAYLGEVVSARTVSVTFRRKTFAVTLMGVTNGTLTATAATVGYGESVTITATPASGYTLSALKINGRTVTPTNGKYTITAVTAQVTVTAVFTK